ncbi:hypothetical protein ACULK2_02335 [Agromyces sp. ZXT2-3]
MTDAATRCLADAAALRASAARVRAAAADAARAVFADFPRSADVLADSLRAAAARFDAGGAGTAAAGVALSSVAAGASDGSGTAGAGDGGFGVPFVDAVRADARLAAAADAGRFAVPDEAAGFRAGELRFAAGLAGSAAVVSVVSSAAVLAREAEARFAAVDRVAADLAAVDFEDDFAAAVFDAEAFAALDRAAADFAAVDPPVVAAEESPDASRPDSDATDSPRRADTPVPVPSGVSSSGPDRETEVTTTTYQPPRPQPWSSHSEFTSWRPGVRSWAEPARSITIRTRLRRNPQRRDRASGIL